MTRWIISALSTAAAVVDEAARMAALGIELIDPTRSPAIYAQCIHIAKRLRQTGRLGQY